MKIQFPFNRILSFPSSMRHFLLYIICSLSLVTFAQSNIFYTPKDWLGKWTVFYSSEKDWSSGNKMKPTYRARDTVGIENGWEWILEVEYEDKEGNSVKEEIKQVYEIGDEAIKTHVGKFKTEKWKVYEYDREEGWILMLKPPGRYSKAQLEVLFNTSSPDEEYVLHAYKRVHAMQFDLLRMHGIYITVDKQRQKPPPYDNLQSTEF